MKKDATKIRSLNTMFGSLFKGSDLEKAKAQAQQSDEEAADDQQQKDHAAEVKAATTPAEQPKPTRSRPTRNGNGKKVKAVATPGEALENGEDKIPV